MKSIRYTHQAWCCLGRNTAVVHLRIQRKKMEYYRSVRGTLQQSTSCHKPNSHDLEKKKGTPLNQVEQHHCSSQLQCLSSPLVKFLSDAAAQAQVPRTLRHLFWAAHTVGSMGHRAEMFSRLASLCPVNLQAAALPLPGLLLPGFAVTSRSHI